MTKMKVLSIDFDYFQKVDAETMALCYPDGHDISPSISSIVWTSRYVAYEEELKNVKLDERHFNVIKSLLADQRYNTPCMAVQSHKHIYDFILDNYNSDKYDGCEIYNIDTHHDMYNSNNELDCGNWGSHIREAIPGTEITWIANNISRDIFSIEEGDELDKIIKNDFSPIIGKKFDLIFLCRSDTWLPPHLDIYFSELFELLTTNFARCIYDNWCNKPRFKGSELDDTIKSHKDAIESLKVLKELNKSQP